MRDDISTLPISKSAKKYARMTSADLGSDWSKKADLYISMAAAETNQPKAGFRNRDAAGKVPHAMKGMAESDFTRASKTSLMKAAQAWCSDLCGDIEMDSNLAIAFAEILDDVRRRGEKAFAGLGESVVNSLLCEYFYEFEGFRGWVSPTGEKFPIDDGEPHGREQTNEILRASYPGWDWESNPNFVRNENADSAYALQYRGWIRVIGDGMYSTWQMTGQVAHVLRRLLEELVEKDPDHGVKVDFYLGRPMEGSAEQVLDQL